jgi:hypothetical protein
MVLIIVTLLGAVCPCRAGDEKDLAILTGIKVSELRYIRDLFC